MLPCVIFYTYYYFLDFVCKNISVWRSNFPFLELSSHFVSVFFFSFFFCLGKLCRGKVDLWWSLCYVSKLFVLYALCMCYVRVLISKSIWVSFVKYEVMLILLQRLAHVFQFVCSVVIVLLAVLYVCINSSTGRSSMVLQL